MQIWKTAPAATEGRPTSIAMVAMFAACLAMSIAVFLHPMSPQDFMDSALSDPIATLFDQGAPMAMAFWTSLVVALLAVVLMLRHSTLLRPPHLHH